MLGASQIAEKPVTEFLRWTLAPSRFRVDEIDAALRRRLSESLSYAVSEFVPARSGVELDELKARIVAAPLSPWVFGLYSKLVSDISDGRCEDAARVFDEIVLAASFAVEDGVIRLRDPCISPIWWDHFEHLLDTDRRRPFKPEPPAGAAFSLCEQDLRGGLAVLEHVDPEVHQETRGLLRMIVLGSPPQSETVDAFNGVSTFFLWGAALLNASLRRSPISIIDLLVHESSHVLLFGLAADEPLTRNDGDQRYASPLRQDERPIDGIFHACFVTTRVHLAMGRLLQSGLLDRHDADEAVGRRHDNGQAARSSLDTVMKHAVPTELGEEILATLRAYWSDAASQ